MSRRHFSQSMVQTFLFGEGKNREMAGETPRLDGGPPVPNRLPVWPPSGGPPPLLLDRPEPDSVAISGSRFIGCRKVGDRGGVLLIEQLECLRGSGIRSILFKMLFQKVAMLSLRKLIYTLMMLYVL